MEPEMHRHVRRVGDQAALLVEQGAGEIEPLLDVHRMAGLLAGSRPICSAIDMKRLLKISSMTGSTFGADRRAAAAATARSRIRWPRSLIGSASRLDDGGRGRVEDDGAGPSIALAGPQLRAVEDRRLVCRALGVNGTPSPARRRPCRRPAGSDRRCRSEWPMASTDDGIHDQRLRPAR